MLILALSAAVELLIFAVPRAARAFRLCLAIAALFIISISTGMLLGDLFSVFAVLLAGVNVYRIFNIMRIIEGRMHEQYLYFAAHRTSSWLLFSSFVITGFWAVMNKGYLTSYGLLATVLGIQLLCALWLLVTTNKHLARMQHLAVSLAVHDTQLPSLTVAIPARNETGQLEDCIKSVLASHYPKLEIIVLDDCSQSTRMPEIIRNFAHDGVRFIQGGEPAENWLAKNQAYDVLANHASGELLLFTGVDIRLQPNTLRQLVGYALQKNKTMLSVMPHNVLYHNEIPFIQPMRYVWELALPRKAFNRPPVLSSCWLIYKTALSQAGGFKAASRMIVPEAYFASHQLRNDSYGFIASGNVLGITSVKDAQEQRATAVRVAYPQIHRRPEVAAAITLTYVSWIATPLVVVMHAVAVRKFEVLLVVALTIMLLCLSMYAKVLKLTYGKLRMLHLLNFPIATLVYVVLVNYSMYKYEYSEVVWKGRNVCLPVMHVVPKLPQI